MTSTQVHQMYAIAKEQYAALGINTEQVIQQLKNVHLSIHCWQADDVTGFEPQQGAMSGGIQATGNYPGKARNIDELRQDITKALSLLPGTHRLSLHEIYGEFNGKFVDRDACTVDLFRGWMQWAKENNIKLDFNSTNFSHPKSGDLSICNPNDEIRAFWVEHMKRCRQIANVMGEYQQDPCCINLWIHDGSKDLTVDRYLYRSLLKQSLDDILKEKYQWEKPSLESKVFGIGLETMTCGSNDFYIGYAAQHNTMLTLDTGHFHPTESVADKVSSLLLCVPELLLHVSRPVRWDSDHVTIMDDPTLELFQEIVRAKAMDRVHYGLDYFDASINRIGAYIIGSRAAQRCMTRALLEPTNTIHQYEQSGRGFQKLAMLEETKSLPWSVVYDEFCVREDVPVGLDIIPEIEQYERDITSKR